MDTSKMRILMSEKATEIQYKHKYKEGDWFYWQGKVVCLGHYVPMSDTIVTPGGYDYDFQDIDYADCIWLPTQAQLQKMLDPCCLEDLIRDFSMWFAWRLGDEGTGFRTSMEFVSFYD